MKFTLTLTFQQKRNENYCYAVVNFFWNYYLCTAVPQTFTAMTQCKILVYKCLDTIQINMILNTVHRDKALEATYNQQNLKI